MASRFVRTLVVVVGVLAGAIAPAAATPAATSPGTWQGDVLQPGRVTDGGLVAVDCVSDTFCVAVGKVPDGANGGERPLTGSVQQWDGTAWSIVALPARGEYGGLSDVSCVSTRFCVAVGGQFDAPLVLWWNGVRWSVDDLDDSLPPAELAGVDCATTTSCVAVGVDHSTATARPAILRYDGHTWSADTPAVVLPQDRDNGIGDVACPTASRCLAVGNTRTGTPVAEIWNGTTWSITPLPRGTARSLAYAIACTGPTSCTLVGHARTGSFVANWDGATWTLAADAAPTGPDVTLRDIACRGPGDCLAVGTAAGTVFAEHLAGGVWSPVPPPPGSGPSTALVGVGCAGAADPCFVVGTATVASPACCAVTVTARFDGGSLTPVPSPSSTVVARVDVVDVDCATASDCTGVGAQYGIGRQIAAIEHWNGTRWTQETLPQPVSALGPLAHLSCADDSSCLAVDGVGTRAARFDGTSWAVVPGPRPGGSAYVRAIECATAGFCLAVGDAYVTPPTGPGSYQALVRRFDGARWTTMTTPALPGTSVLFGASCVSTVWCVAVGGAANSVAAQKWNGTAWNPLTPAVPADGTGGTLFAVSCVATTFCMAVGNYRRTRDDALVALLERWNGRAWRVLPAPRDLEGADLQAVSCATPTSCTAGGATTTSSTKPLAVDWDGARWTVSTLGPAAFGRMTGISCPAPRTCKATGLGLASSAPSRVVSESP